MKPHIFKIRKRYNASWSTFLDFYAIKLLDVDVEAQVEIAGSLPAVESPVLGRVLPEQDGHAVPRDADCFEAFDDLPVEGTLGVEGAAGEAVDGHTRVVVGLAVLEAVDHAVGFVGQEPDVAVLFWDLERGDQAGVHGVDDGGFLVRRVRPANLDQ